MQRCRPRDMKCTDSDNKHSPNFLKVILKFESGSFGEEIVVRWCRCCGAITVDEQVDGRLFRPSMRWPTYAVRSEDEKEIPLATLHEMDRKGITREASRAPEGDLSERPGREDNQPSWITSHNNAYPEDCVRLELMVDPMGGLHAIGGALEMNPQRGESKYIGMNRFKRSR